ncbi:unnamed protein product [Clonostachys solani]|uniref:Uncharacterized protein n=1 Tax=Clonostachys solani TaxID=160281 RepID=A0A9P0ELF3_9HYPO|nr:unnamed protein product [Clonostachys solani]
MPSKMAPHAQREDLTIYYNDSIDSDNAAAALALLKEVAQRRPAERVIWILEPRQVAWGPSMGKEESDKCKKLLIKYFPDKYKTDYDAFKALLGSRLKEKKLLERQEELRRAGQEIPSEDLDLLRKATKPINSHKEQSKKHAKLMAWDLAGCLTHWSKEYYRSSPAPKVEVLVDYDSLEEIQNPVNLHLHYHEELVSRTNDEIERYNAAVQEEYGEHSKKEGCDSSNQGKKALEKDEESNAVEKWYEECINKEQKRNEGQNTSVGQLDIESLCKAINAARNVRFMGGSSLRILRQFIEKKVASKVDCYLQAGTQDFSANLFPNQFNIGLNIEAASFVLREYKQFSSFTIVPSATAQSLKFSLVGLQKLGHDCLGKKMLGYNGKVEAKDIAAGDFTIEKDFPEKTASMPDLTTFLCVLKEKELGASRSYVEVVYSIEKEAEPTNDDAKKNGSQNGEPKNGDSNKSKPETSEPERDQNGKIKEGVSLRLKDADQGILIYRLPPTKELTAEEVVKLLDFSGGGD